MSPPLRTSWPQPRLGALDRLSGCAQVLLLLPVWHHAGGCPWWVAWPRAPGRTSAHRTLPWQVQLAAMMQQQPGGRRVSYPALIQALRARRGDAEQAAVRALQQHSVPCRGRAG